MSELYSPLSKPLHFVMSDSQHAQPHSGRRRAVVTPFKDTKSSKKNDLARRDRQPVSTSTSSYLFDFLFLFFLKHELLCGSNEGISAHFSRSLRPRELARARLLPVALSQRSHEGDEITQDEEKTAVQPSSQTVLLTGDQRTFAEQPQASLLGEIHCSLGAGEPHADFAGGRNVGRERRAGGHVAPRRALSRLRHVSGADVVAGTWRRQLVHEHRRRVCRFLFEGGCGNALYTGDFRLASGDAARMEHLHSGGRVKDIRSVYVDSTFFDPRFYQIPSREACVSAILRLVGDWIARSARHVVWLNCKAAYGYEYLFTRLGAEFNTRVHVNNLLMFRRMPEILSYVTGEHRTQIHACRHPKVTTSRRKDDVRLEEADFVCAQNEANPRGDRLPCGRASPDGADLRVLSIKPSTMWFGERTRKTDVVVRSGSNAFRACFSFHSSYCEIKDFLSYLRPVQVFPNVVPIGRTLSEVTHMLRTVCRKPPQENITYRPLGALKRSAATTTPHDWDSDNDLFDASAAAPLRKKPTASRRVPNEPGPYAMAPPAPTEDSLQPDPRDDDNKNDHTDLKYNYVDCAESNDDSEDDEGSEEDEASGTKTSTQTGSASVELPKWQDFFTVEPLPDSQNSQSQPCSAPSPAPTRPAGSQTPEAFSEREDDADDSFVLSPSASDSSSQNRDADGEDRGAGDAPSEPPPGSRVSSDYGVSCTPDSKRAPVSRKLASGEDVSCPD
ncbi:protein artemis isoform X1 [Phycodurus eques]|uniref:protein artemis isoform X1 n=1 Tax=Phycodurus eques TaxID=693459 RepID=UPI002ACE4016|nr:protein artemis isoform X1 [Phycodurus eques]